jgi:hypothetical protein
VGLAAPVSRVWHRGQRGRPTASGRAQLRLVGLRQDRREVVRLGRVEQALLRWEAWETNALLPNDLQRPATPPVLTREALDGLHRMLTEELARLDGRSDPAARGSP